MKFSIQHQYQIKNSRVEYNSLRIISFQKDLFYFANDTMPFGNVLPSAASLTSDGESC